LTLKAVARNAGWLGLVHGLNYAVPILTVPVVARALGPNTYGILATFYAYATYAGVLTLYGFNVTGPRAIAALHDDDVHALSKTVSTIVSAQALIGVVAVAVSFAALSLIPYGDEYRTVGLVVLMHTFSGSLLPQWVFIGLQRTRNLALIQLVIQAVAATIVLVEVRTQSDLLLLVTVRCSAAALILIFSLAELARYGIKWCTPTKVELVAAVRRASRLFFSAVSINLYTTTTTLIVAFVLGPVAAGAFALANRVRGAAAGVIGLITQAVYPFLCRIAGREETHEEAWARRLFLRAIVAISGVISLTLFGFAPFIIWLAGGRAFQDATQVLSIIAFLPMVAALSNTLGRQTMLPLHMDREYTRIVMLAALFGVTSMFFLTHKLGLRGAALGMLGVEMYVAGAFAVALQRRKSILSLFFKYR